MAVSCAEYETEDNLTAQKRIREAWMRVNKGGVIDADENGLYVFEKTVGKGADCQRAGFVDGGRLPGKALHRDPLHADALI
ncbi:MAG: hypothetical protein IKX71_05590 [Bacteroidales bacterium]|nr:hypothetical protein [Bacteroidales bacterium]